MPLDFTDRKWDRMASAAFDKTDHSGRPTLLEEVVNEVDRLEARGTFYKRLLLVLLCSLTLAFALGCRDESIIQREVIVDPVHGVGATFKYKTKLRWCNEELNFFECWDRRGTEGKCSYLFVNGESSKEQKCPATLP